MSIRTTAAALAITGLLALPAGALAGGWATVGLSSTPDGLKPGATWNVELEVLQHGRTPLPDVHPTVTITSGTATHTFATRPAGKPGVYRARVRFPGPGTWRYVVDDGFTARHSYPPVRISSGGSAAATARTASTAATAPAGGDGQTIALDRLALAALAGLLVGALVFVLPRRRRRRVAALGGG